ncbi:hypothetical protein CL658_05225 [bacterium]|nr:hypothetical protein [bacterium]|tara:strand:- start:1415 stop:2332 length:918 start_codon:yes stop_codon:yes gene_type:complete
MPEILSGLSSRSSVSHSNQAQNGREYQRVSRSPFDRYGGKKNRKTNGWVYDFKNAPSLDDSILDAIYRDSQKKGKKIVHFDLTNTKITTVPDLIGGFRHLKYLNLNDNRLRELPSSIGSLIALKIFFVEQNELKLLPDQIGDLTNLQRLFLDNNNLGFMPPYSMGNLENLIQLSLEHNQLIFIPDSIKTLKNLKEIKVKGNYLTERVITIGINIQVWITDQRKLTGDLETSDPAKSDLETTGQWDSGISDQAKSDLETTDQWDSDISDRSKRDLEICKEGNQKSYNIFYRYGLGLINSRQTGYNK